MQGFTCPALLRIPLSSLHFDHGIVTLFDMPFQTFDLAPLVLNEVLQPRDCSRFGLLRFRSPLLTESLSFSFPVLTEMFHFGTFAPFRVCFTQGLLHSEI
jgi:hypothetical protein